MRAIACCLSASLPFFWDFDLFFVLGWEQCFLRFRIRTPFCSKSQNFRLPRALYTAKWCTEPLGGASSVHHLGYVRTLKKHWKRIRWVGGWCTLPLHLWTGSAPSLGLLRMLFWVLLRLCVILSSSWRMRSWTSPSLLCGWRYDFRLGVLLLREFLRFHRVFEWSCFLKRVRWNRRDQ